MAKAKRYPLEDGSNAAPTLAGLKRLGRERQLRAMQAWFARHYVDDPSKQRIGGFGAGQWNSSITNWTGLRELLDREFGDVIHGAQIEEAVGRITLSGKGAWYPSVVFGFAEQAGLPGVFGVSTWDDGSTWSDGTGWAEPNFDQLAASPEAGLKLRAVDDDQTTRRQDLLIALGDVHDHIEALKQGGYGSNSGAQLLPAASDIESAMDVLREEAASKRPAEERVKAAASKLISFGQWLSREGTKEAVKEILLKPLISKIFVAAKEVIKYFYP